MSPQQILAHCDDGSLWAGGSGFDAAIAYEHALTLRELRLARGERPVGYKIGFTNRNIWPVYQVFGPIWGTMFDTTVTHCEGSGTVSLAGTCQPRIEPEVVFGIASTPPPRATLQQLFECIEWIAPGFEIVQSHLAGWKFAAPDTMADGGLHARLLVGSRMPLAQVGRDADELNFVLARTQVTLSRHGEKRDEGIGANVLDGPLHALKHFVDSLRNCPGAPDLLPGDIVTTGTWTDAWPVAAGETWKAQFDAPLAPLEIRFT